MQKSYAESNIVYLGAGLETAYDRLSDKIENRTVHWYEADLPEVIEARKKYLVSEKMKRSLQAICLNWNG